MTAKKKSLSTTAVVSPRFFIAVMEGKGGVGKSVSAQASTVAVSLDGSRVHVAESDLTNSTMSMIHGDQTTLVDAGAVDVEGYMHYLAERAANGEEFDHVVLDTGARDEANFRPFIADFARDLKANYGMHLVVIRPMTLSHFVQSNIATFVEKCKNDDMGVVILRNQSQGRQTSHFHPWMEAASTKSLLATPGVVLCDLLDAGVQHSDNATSFGMSLVEAAAGDFSRVGEDESYARQVIHRPVQLFLNKWLQRQATALRAAIFASIGQIP